RFEYDRYLWLVELLKKVGYDDAAIQRDYPFQIQDVLMSAIFAAASAALASLGETFGYSRAEVGEARQWCQRASDAVQRAWNDDLKLALDWDVNAGEHIRVETCAGLAPLLVPGLSADLLRAVVDRLN